MHNTIPPAALSDPAATSNTQITNTQQIDTNIPQIIPNGTSESVVSDHNKQHITDAVQEDVKSTNQFANTDSNGQTNENDIQIEIHDTGEQSCKDKPSSPPPSSPALATRLSPLSARNSANITPLIIPTSSSEIITPSLPAELIQSPRPAQTNLAELIQSPRPQSTHFGQPIRDPESLQSSRPKSTHFAQPARTSLTTQPVLLESLLSPRPQSTKFSHPVELLQSPRPQSAHFTHPIPDSTFSTTTTTTTTTTTPQAPELIQSPRPTQPTQITQPFTESAMPTQPTQITQPFTESAMPTQPTQITQPFTESAMPTQPTQITQPFTESAMPTQPTQITQPTDPTQLTQITQPTDPIQLTQITQVTQITQPTDPTQTTQITQVTQTTQIVQPVSSLPPTTTSITPTLVQPITPVVNASTEIRSDTESDRPERQPFASSSSKNRRFSMFVEPPMPLEHKKDRLRHHVRLAHKKNTLGETIYKGHPSWLLMRDIQTGLYTNIKNMAQRTVEVGLFETPAVTTLPIAPNAKFTFKFKDYCPMAFYNLREHFGINHVDYVTSLCQNWNEVGTPGKSGSLFFFSLDNQYVLKTIPKREAKILRSLLPAYYKHMTTHTNSLLTKFMGLHRVKPHKGRQVRFLVMGNLFNSNLRVHMRFDLKGSTIGRELTPLEREKKNPTYKDLDFRRLNRKLHLGPNREEMLKQLQIDTEFLSSQYIMDYSLLVGVHFLQAQADPKDDEDGEGEDEYDEPRTPPLNRSVVELPPYVADTEIRPPNQALSIFEREEGGVRARLPDGTPLEEYYYIGVIDILMHYSLRKQVEHAAKRVLHPRGEISSVEPHSFATRFFKFAVESID